MRRIADYRADDKTEPEYYARHTVTKAQVALDATATQRPNEEESNTERSKAMPEH
jgi:hypothetical protein